MNPYKVTDIAPDLVEIEAYDEDARQWLRMQLKIASDYAAYLVRLAKKGVLNMTLPALHAALTARGSEAKMVFTPNDHDFIDRATSVLDDDDTSIKSLARRGYDSDGSTISYKNVALWPSSVFDAPSETDDNDLRTARKAVTAIVRPAYSSAFAAYLDNAIRCGDPESAFIKLSLREKKALSAGQDVSGGFLVPADVSGDVLARMAATSIVRRGATVRPTFRDLFTCPAFAPHGTSPSVYSSGFTGTWSPEASVFSDQSVGFEIVSVPVRKLRVGAKVSRDLAADVSGVEWLVSNGADNLAAGEDQAFLAGIGASNEPRGILNSDISTTDVSGTSADTISNTAGADGSGSKMLTFAGTLPSQYQRDAVLIMASATEASVNKLIDAQRGWLFPRQRGADGRRVLMGFPVENSPHVQLEGTDGNKVIVLGDLSGYLVASRGLIVMRLRERFADTDQIGVVLTDRVGGVVHNVDAFRVAVV